MTAMLILNGVFMVMIVATILSVLVWGIVTDRPWRARIRQARVRARQRPVPSPRRAPAQRRGGQPSWSA